MFFDIELELLDDHFDELERRIRELERHTTYVGWFAEQGQHPSGFSYVGLATLHHNGVPSQHIPPRPLADIAFNSFNFSASPFKDDLSKYLSNISRRSNTFAEGVFKPTAMLFGEHMQSIMGDPSKLKSNSKFTQRIKASMVLDPNSPLVMEGDLRDNLSYKIGNAIAKKVQFYSVMLIQTRIIIIYKAYNILL